MPGKSAAIKVNIIGDAKPLAAGLTQAERGVAAFSAKVQAAGVKMRSIGKMMTVAFTLPVVGLGYAAIKAAQSFDKAYDQIRVGTGATGKTLESLKDNFRNVVKSVPTDFESASTAIADLNTRLGLTGKPLEAVSARVLELSRMTGEDLNSVIESSSRVMGDWGVTQAKTADTMDYLFKVSQSTGVTVDQLSQNLVKYGAPLRQLGFTMENSAVLMGKFEKEGVNTELVLGSMRIALGKMAREGEPAVETFKRVTGEIKNAGDASEANKIALELFGARAGPDMAASIREGRFEIDDLVATLDASSETILGAAKDTESWTEKWTKFKNSTLVALEPLLNKLFDGLGRMMDWLTPKIESLVNWFTNLSPGVQKVIGVLVGLLAVAGPVVYIVGALVTLVGLLISPIGLVVLAIAALTAAFIYFYNNSEGFRNFVDTVVAAVRDGLAAAFNWFVDTVWPKLQDFFGWITGTALPFLQEAFGTYVEFIRLEAQVLRAIWDWIWDKISAFVTWFQTNVLPIITSVVDLIVALFQRIQAIVEFVWPTISSIINTVVENLRTLITGFIDFIEPIWNGFWGVISAVVSGVWDTIRNIIEGALGFIRGTIEFFTGIISGDWGRAWDGIRSAVTSVWDAINRIIMRAVSTIWSVIRSVFGAISGTISNIWNGIVSVTRRVWDTVTGIIRGALQGAWGIVQWIVGGIRGAFNGLSGAVRSALSGLASAVSAPFRAAAGAIRSVWNSTIGGKGITVPDIPGLPGRGRRFEIPRLHEGGYAGGLAPNEQLTVLEAGESVRTAAQEKRLQQIVGGLASKQGATINLNFYGPVTGQDGARWVAEAVEQAVAQGYPMLKLKQAVR